MTLGVAAVAEFAARIFDGLDLENLRAVITEDLRTERTGQVSRKIDDLDSRDQDLGLIDLYLNSMEERANPYASPLFAPDLRGVAPAHIMNAEFDQRRDECEAYAARLQDAGVPATARTMPGHIHGSAWLIKED